MLLSQVRALLPEPRRTGPRTSRSRSTFSGPVRYLPGSEDEGELMELGAGKIAVVTVRGVGSVSRWLMHWQLPAARSCWPTCRTMPSSERPAAIAELGVETLAVRTDVSKADQVDALAQATLDRFGAVHVVCNNAGVAGSRRPVVRPDRRLGVDDGGQLLGHGLRRANVPAPHRHCPAVVTSSTPHRWPGCIRASLLPTTRASTPSLR